MVTFTFQEELREFMRSNQRIAYAALFSASTDAMKKLAQDPKYIGGDMPGFFRVLHTWGRQLQYHPHIHFGCRSSGTTRNCVISARYQTSGYLHVVKNMVLAYAPRKIAL
jgi:hypothetical protein